MQHCGARSVDTTTTDGETSGMGSSLDELMESSTESASESSKNEQVTSLHNAHTGDYEKLSDTQSH